VFGERVGDLPLEPCAGGLRGGSTSRHWCPFAGGVGDRRCVGWSTPAVVPAAGSALVKELS
jgi:hypothetical protein